MEGPCVMGLRQVSAPWPRPGANFIVAAANRAPPYKPWQQVTDLHFCSIPRAESLNHPPCIKKVRSARQRTHRFTPRYLLSWSPSLLPSII